MFFFECTISAINAMGIDHHSPPHIRAIIIGKINITAQMNMIIR